MIRFQLWPAFNPHNVKSVWREGRRGSTALMWVWVNLTHELLSSCLKAHPFLHQPHKPILKWLNSFQEEQTTKVLPQTSGWVYVPCSSGKVKTKNVLNGLQNQNPKGSWPANVVSPNLCLPKFHSFVSPSIYYIKILIYRLCCFTKNEL